MLKKVLMAFCLSLALGIASEPVACMAARDDEVIKMINSAREEAGLEDVTKDGVLTAAAVTRARECNTSFSHIRPNGKAWYTVGSEIYGENLAHAKNRYQSRPDIVVLSWLYSPTHELNIMDSECTKVGVAFYQNGHGDTFIAAEFN